MKALGFTLIELLLAIAIIGILAAIGVVSLRACFKSFRQRGQDGAT